MSLDRAPKLGLEYAMGPCICTLVLQGSALDLPTGLGCSQVFCPAATNLQVSDQWVACIQSSPAQVMLQASMTALVADSEGNSDLP